MTIVTSPFLTPMLFASVREILWKLPSGISLTFVQAKVECFIPWGKYRVLFLTNSPMLSVRGGWRGSCHGEGIKWNPLDQQAVCTKAKVSTMARPGYLTVNGLGQRSIFLSLPCFLFGIAKIQSLASSVNKAFLHSSF